MRILDAVKCVCAALRKDKGYFISWQSNIAMAFVDENRRQGSRDSYVKVHKVPAHCATCETGCEASDTAAVWCLTTVKPAQKISEAVTKSANNAMPKCHKCKKQLFVIVNGVKTCFHCATPYRGTSV